MGKLPGCSFWRDAWQGLEQGPADGGEDGANVGQDGGFGNKAFLVTLKVALPYEVELDGGKNGMVDSLSWQPRGLNGEKPPFPLPTDRWRHEPG